MANIKKIQTSGATYDVVDARIDESISASDVNKILTVQADGTIAAENAPAAGVWGQITGTLSNQTDLQQALDAKQATLATQTAYNAQGSATKVPQITTNALGQVTSISEVTIQQPTLTDLGVTATAQELNVLDGITASTAELNYVDGVTSSIQAQLNGKQATIPANTYDAYGSATAVQDNLDTHTGNTTVHITATERTNWDGVLEKIPTEASSSNKLADKSFVNSSIATNTANYISNNGQPFTSVEQLEAYSGTVTNNDYAFVTGTDEAGNTYYDRYKATVTTTKSKSASNAVTWAKEFRLNNSSFTAAQWAAINSGITSGDVALIATALQPAALNAYRTSADQDVIDGGKQATISDLSTIRTNASTGATHAGLTSGNPHNVSKSDVGLGNVGNFKAVSTVASQGLTTAEQTNARTNIGAGTGTITGITMNGSSKGTSGVVDLGTVLTSVPTAAVNTLGAIKYAQGTFSLTTSSWANDTTYSDYGKRASIAISGCTASHFPEVVFDLATATGGKVAPIAESYAGGIYVYAKEAVTCSGSWRITYNA